MKSLKEAITNKNKYILPHRFSFITLEEFCELNSICEDNLTDSQIEYFYNNTDKCIANRICPKCYNKLVARTNSYDGSYFLGCSVYGKTGCNFTINYKEYYNIKDKVKTY